MAIDRISFDRLVWRKVENQIKKNKRQDVATHLKTLKVTIGPSNAVIFWKPDRQSLVYMKEMLELEEPFLRKNCTADKVRAMIKHLGERVSIE